MILELLKVGKYKGKEITSEMLDEIVKNFQGRVPVTPGHEFADYSPALAWVEKVWRDGSSLYGEINPTFLLHDLFELGLYGNWSVGIKHDPDKGYYLHHVALLGAMPPAIKDLQVVALNDDEAVEKFEFQEKPEYKSFFNKNLPIAPPDTEWDADAAKKRLVDRGGFELLRRCCLAVDVSEGDLPEALYRYKFPVCDIVDGKVQIVPKAVATAAAYLAGARGVRVSPELAKVVEPLVRELQEKIRKKKEGEQNMADQIQALEEELKKAKEEIARMKAEQKKAKMLALADAAQGRIPKEALDKLLRVVEALPVEQEIQLSDEESKDVLDVLIDVVRAIPLPTQEGMVVFKDEEDDKINWKL